MICKPIQIKFLFSECTTFDKHHTKNLMQIALVILEKFLLKVTYQKQMEHSTRENQRYYIFVEWKNGSTAAEIHQKLVVAEGDQALSLRTIHCWIEAFELGKQSVKDEACSGCPHKAVTPATIGKVEDFVSEDHHITT
jgi:HTH domain in Mos1 transposase